MMRPDLLVVDAVDDRHDRDDVDAGRVQVLDRPQLDVEQVADAAMRVGGVADAVELQIGVAQARFGGRLREVEALREFDAVGRGLHRVVADLARVANRVEEIRRQRRLAAGELHRHLALRLDGDGVVEHRLDVVPRQLVHEADLVGIHEARVAHHVAAVGQVHRQHRAAAVLDRRAAVVVELLVVVRADVAAREHFFEVLEEGRVDRHHVLEVPVDRAVLDHDDLAVLLVDGRLDLADLLVEQRLERAGAVEDRLSRFAHAGRTERVGLTRPAERRLGLLVRLQHRLVGPLRRERRVLADLVELRKDLPDSVGGNRQTLFGVFNRRVHVRSPQAKYLTGLYFTDFLRALAQQTGSGPERSPNWLRRGLNGQYPTNSVGDAALPVTRINCGRTRVKSDILRQCDAAPPLAVILILGIASLTAQRGRRCPRRDRTRQRIGAEHSNRTDSTRSHGRAPRRPNRKCRVPPRRLQEYEPIDLRNRFVVPGLIDAHVHIASLPQLRAALESGVTTVRSAGVSNFVDVGMRELVKKGFVAGPDVVAAGYHVRPEVAPEMFIDFPELGDLMSGVTGADAHSPRGARQPVARRRLDQGARHRARRHGRTPIRASRSTRRRSCASWSPKRRRKEIAGDGARARRRRRGRRGARRRAQHRARHLPDATRRCS